jgi:hypothetical protein
MHDNNKDIVSPSDTAPPHDDEVQTNGSEKGSGEAENERVVEYLRQRLASVVAAGVPPETDADPYVERSHFSMDLSDESGMEDWSAYEGSENGGGTGTGSEAAYPNLRAVSWEVDELDPAWIIDRYCSWQEADLEDAMIEEGEGSEVNRLLSQEWRGWNEGREKEIGIGEGSGRGGNVGADANSRGKGRVDREFRYM